MSILKSPIQPNGLKEVCLGSTLGELRYYHSHPMWFFFFADDFVLQEEGYAPGFWGVYIDKLTGKIMDTEEVRFYQFL